MTGSETKKNPLPFLALFHFLFSCNVLWCSSSLDLVKRSSGVAWQQPSAALSLQSPCSAVRLPPQHCQAFLFFLHGSTFPSALPIFVHLFQQSFFIILSSVCSLTGYFQLRIACQILASWAPAVISFVFVSGWRMTAQSPRVHQHPLNYFLLTEGILATASLWYHFHECQVMSMSFFPIFLFNFTSQL